MIYGKFSKTREWITSNNDHILCFKYTHLQKPKESSLFLSISPRKRTSFNTTQKRCSIFITCHTISCTPHPCCSSNAVNLQSLNTKFPHRTKCQSFWLLSWFSSVHLGKLQFNSILKYAPIASYKLLLIYLNTFSAHPTICHECTERGVELQLQPVCTSAQDGGWQSMPLYLCKRTALPTVQAAELSHVAK